MSFQTFVTFSLGEDTFARKNKEKRVFLWFFAHLFVSLQAEPDNVTAMSTEMMTQQIAEYFKTQPVLKAWLFGSFARGEETPESDVDILVILDHSEPVGLKFFGMYEDLKELLGRDIDLVVDRTLASFARESVDRDKILIYERAA